MIVLPTSMARTGAYRTAAISRAMSSSLVHQPQEAAAVGEIPDDHVVGLGTLNDLGRVANRPKGDQGALTGLGEHLEAGIQQCPSAVRRRASRRLECAVREVGNCRRQPGQERRVGKAQGEAGRVLGEGGRVDRGVHLSVGGEAEVAPGRNQVDIRRCLSRAAI